MFNLIDTQGSFNEFLELLGKKEKEVIYCDIETTGLDWLSDKILLFQLMFEDGEIYIIDVRELRYNNLTSLMNLIKKSICVFHNCKFDLKFLARNTGILLENIYDTMVMEALINSGIGKPTYKLSYLAEKYAGIFMEKDTRMDFVKYPDDKPFTEAMLNYSALDVKVLRDIMTEQGKIILETHEEKIAKIENDLLPIVAQMEMDGIKLNTKAWLEVEARAIEIREKLNEELKTQIVEFLITIPAANGFELARKALIPVTTKKLTKHLEDITNVEDLRGWLYEKFNTKSSQQMKAILHLMQIKVKDTNAKTLEDYKQYPIINTLLEIREVNKQIDSYGSNVLQHIHPITGKIHTDYLTIGTVTGRFSSNNPNMQQVPRKGGYRECFIPDEDYLFAAVDYSQQEYRLAGAISKDDAIITAYINGSDMHTATAQVQFNKEVVNSEERNIGKTLNFAILYGSTEYGLKHNLGVSLDEAKSRINRFWEGYPRLHAFLGKVGEKIIERGFSSTVLGRRRYNVLKPTFFNSYELKKWEERILREGRNHIIQGGGADMLKIAMIEIYRRNPFGRNLKLCLQVHDEIVVQVHKSVAEEGLQFVIDIMEEVESRFLGAIPAKADGKLKEKWSK